MTLLAHQFGTADTFMPMRIFLVFQSSSEPRKSLVPVQDVELEVGSPAESAARNSDDLTGRPAEHAAAWTPDRACNGRSAGEHLMKIV